MRSLRSRLVSSFSKIVAKPTYGHSVIVSAGMCAIAGAVCASLPAQAQSRIATTTALTITANSGAATNITSGTTITLSAKVTPASGTIKAGQVDFCDARAKYCTDVHILATAQVTTAGTAIIKLRPTAGNHSYKAQFLGTTAFAPSASATTTVTVTGVATSATTITQSGSPGNYSLTATVNGTPHNGNGPTGTVSFLDKSNSNSIFAKAALGEATLKAVSAGVFTQLPETADGLVAADFDSDGNLDMAVGLGSSSNPTVAILLGDGTGNFSPVSKSTITAPGWPVLVQDFNADGHPDILLVDQAGEQFNLLLGHGDGTFTLVPGSPINYLTSYYPVIAGDFNGDGIPDLFVGAFDYPILLLGKGDGTFTSIPTSINGNEFYEMQAADLNGDGITDVILSEYQQIVVYLGQSNGSFVQASVTPAAAGFSANSIIGDFNNDGKLDLAVNNGDSQIDVFPGKGDGTFGSALAPVKTSIHSTQGSVFMGDFNGDGIADLFVTADNGTPESSVQFGKGNGTFSEVTEEIPDLACCDAPLLGDFNGDGATDMAIGASYYTASANNAAEVLLANQMQASVIVNGIAPPGPGTHLVAASFPGDSNFKSSISQTTALQAQVADPVLTPVAGTYKSSIKVTITDTTPGAVIYYAAFGTANTAGYVPYTGPITLSIDGSETVQAYASEAGYRTSNTVTSSYTLQLPPTPAPTISLASGSYSAAQTVTITDSLAGAAIYYTTDGTLPNTTSKIYNGPITIASSGTLVANAYAPAHSFSPPSSAQYIIGNSPISLIYSIAGTGIYGYGGSGGPATKAQLDYSVSLARDSAGNLYISDRFNHMVRKVTAGTGIITNFAGSGLIGNSGDGGPAAKAELTAPGPLAIDPSGKLYIADTETSLIRVVDLNTGIINAYAGNTTAFGSGDGGSATNANLGSIGGLAVDGSHNLYLSEIDNGTVRMISNTTGIITTVVGVGISGYSGDSGPAKNARLAEPSGLVFASDGTLYIADMWNCLVRAVDFTTGIITTVAGKYGTNGYPNPGHSGDGGPAIGAQLSYPNSLALDASGNLYIADGGNEGAVRRVSNGIISTVAGDGQACQVLAGDGSTATGTSLCLPQGIAVDSTGNLYINETGNARVRKVVKAAVPPTAKTATPTFSAGGGTYAEPLTVTISSATPGASIYITADGTIPTTNATTNGYSLPVPVSGTVTLKAIAIAPGSLVSNMTSATYIITAPSPSITTIAGDGIFGFYGDGGPAANVEFGLPEGIAIDTSGNIYVSDSSDNVIWKITAKTGIASIYAGTGVVGYSGDNGAATDATLNGPEALAVDAAGDLFIADTANHVVRKVTANTGLITTVAGNRNTNFGGNDGDGSPATAASLDFPRGVALDDGGNLYIADSGHDTVRKVTASTGIITTVAGVSGSYSSSGDGGLATKASLANPTGVAVDHLGNIFIATLDAGRIRKVTAATGIISTIAGIGDTPGTDGDGGAATNAHTSPQGLVLDAAGNLYVADSSKIRVVSASTGIITRAAGIGLFGFSGDGGAATAAEIRNGPGLAFDAAGNLYFTDSSNYRVRKVAMGSATTAAPVFSVASGSYNQAQSVMITDATAGASIYYTLNGTLPTTSSAKYSGAITITQSATLRAIAVTSSGGQSAVASATYTLVAAPPVISPVAGSYTGSLTVTITSASPTATIFYTTNGTLPTTSSAKYTGPITVSVNETVRAMAAQTGFSPSSVASNTYSILAVTPTFTPKAGTYTGSQQVTISDATAAAVVHFTTDGSTPTTSSPVYTAPSW